MNQSSGNSSELTASNSLDAADSSVQNINPEQTVSSVKAKSAPVSVNRSESFKERLSQKRNRSNRRKTSDPSLSSKTK